MTLDTTTLRVAFSITALTLLVLFYFVTFRSTRSAYSAWWCVALGMFLTGSAAYLLDGTFHQRWANPLGNVLLVTGAIGVWAGARSLRAARPPAWIFVAAPLLTVAVAVVDNPATNTWAGGAVFLALMCLGIALASGELWRLEPGYSRVHRPLAAASGLLAAYYFVRCIVFVAEGPDGAVFRTYFGSDTTTLITLILLVAVSFSMASLSNEQLTRELRASATHDGLTGVLNRSGFLDLATEELRHMKRVGSVGSLVLVDLDHFKSVNDEYGHTAGDSAIRAFASACKGTVRATDYVGRYGGDEFVILLPGAGPDGAEKIATQISQRLADMRVTGDTRLPTASFGIASIDPVSADLDTVIASADAALYRAKSLGRNRVCRA